MSKEKLPSLIQTIVDDREPARSQMGWFAFSMGFAGPLSVLAAATAIHVSKINQEAALVSDAVEQQYGPVVELSVSAEDTEVEFTPVRPIEGEASRCLGRYSIRTIEGPRTDLGVSLTSQRLATLDAACKPL